jgi:hypothetical protein
VPARTRTDDSKQRTVTVAGEFLGHTRMNRWDVVGVAHWFVAVGFFTLVLTLVNAFGQLFENSYRNDFRSRQQISAQAEVRKASWASSRIFQHLPRQTWHSCAAPGRPEEFGARA